MENITSAISVQVDSQDKEMANDILKSLGLNMSTYVNMAIKQLLYTNGLPFEVKNPISNEKNELTAYTDCKNVTGMARDAINGLNEKKLINISSDISTIKVYTSKENINKLKANRKKYAQESEDRFNWYDERISELEEENERLSEELNKEIDRLSEELNECRKNEEKN